MTTPPDMPADAVRTALRIYGAADARMDFTVTQFEVGDCPAVHIRLDMRDGFFSVTTDGRYTPRHEIGRDDETTIIISLRDRGDSEQSILAAAFRRIADILSPVEDDMITVTPL